MSTQSLINQEALLQQIVSQAGIVKKEHQDGLKKRFQKKYVQHLNMVQYHKLRQDRFALSQKKVLDRQHQSIQKTKEYITLRQNKANYNKSNSLIQKSKRVEEDLNRWQKIVQKNKKQHEARVKQSIKLIQEWNDKLSESSSRKNLSQSKVNRLGSRQSISNSPTNIIKETQQQKQQQHSKDQNPQSRKIIEARYNRQRRLYNSRKKLRVSTQSLHERKSKIDEEFIEKSLMKTGEKQDRINEARFIKHYMLERKIKLRHDKEETLKKKRDQNIVSIKQDIEARNQMLDKKYKNQKIKIREKRASLPLISGQPTHALLHRMPGQQWRSPSPKQGNTSALHRQEQMKKNERNSESYRTLEPSYDKLVMDKLKDVAILIRKGRKM